MKTAILIVLLASLCLANQRIQGWCEKGGMPVVTSGLSSSTLVQASYPNCTINVYITGSGGVAATLYSDASGTPLSNPFQADQDGRYYFYAADGTYDIQLSGVGLPPYTLSGISNTPGGGGGGTGISSVGLTVPGGFSVYNSPLTANGMLGIGLASQFPSYVLISPTAGGVPAWRRLTTADVPASGLGTVTNTTGLLTATAVVVGNGANDAKASEVTIDSTGAVIAPGGFSSPGPDTFAMAMGGATSGVVTQTVHDVAGTWTFTWPAAAPTLTGQSLLGDTAGNLFWGGTIIVYRCTVAATLRVGQLTTVSADCGTAVDTGLRVNRAGLHGILHG